MRLLVSTLLAAAVVAAPAARALADCAKPAEQQALDVEGLKSELMVTALSCKMQAKYNAFMAKYGPTLAENEKLISAYFKRNYGRQADKMHDEYITQLANVQSQDGLKGGTAFCDELGSIFDEVLSLRSSADLQDFTRGKPIVQPVSFTACSGPEESPLRATRIRHGRVKHS